MSIGECQSKCAHLSGIPLYPQVAQLLHRIYLAKGVAATTAIEGNTLSENQVLQQIDGKLEVPPSQEYLKQENDNIIRACNLILKQVKQKNPPPISVEHIKKLNRRVLNKLQLPSPDIVPGEIRQYSVGVGNYRGAPADECEYLLKRLCDWLNGPEFLPTPGMEIAFAIIKAIVAHLYIAWIHPFGDGNGRTARLLEFQILLCSGVPSPSAQLLSNHYNLTRNEYYRRLDSARRAILEFLEYSIEGFKDGLRDQINMVQSQQLNIAWINYVYEQFERLHGTPHERRKNLILDLSDSPSPVALSELRQLSPRVAVAYKDLHHRTLVRDIANLLQMGLITSGKDGKWRAKKEVMLEFFAAKVNVESDIV